MTPMLAGRTAVVTGSGRGIGKASALLMAEQGAALVVSDRDSQEAQETVAEIVRRGGRAIGLPGDVTDDAFADELISAAIDSFGGVDILVNNAGYAWDSVLAKMTDEQWDAMLAVHLTAPFRILRAAAPFFKEAAKREAAEGRKAMRKIVNVSSTSGLRGQVGQANYAACKAGILGLTKTVAREWGRYHVNCNAVVFGWIATRMTDVNGGAGNERAEAPTGVPAAVLRQIEEATPLGRRGTVEEAAGAILFLSSPLSDFITGHALCVDGGLTM
jgi:3-oxoacyl-[acyl-carrier protein] reductase